MSAEFNPFSPPDSDTRTELVEKADRRLASQGYRFGTFVIDYICFLSLSFGLGVTVMLVFGQEGMARLNEVPDQLEGMAIIACYYCFFEGIWARTPGKFVLGTIVVNEAGGKPTFGQILGRTLCRFIPFEPFSCLGERGWHDTIPKTRVVRIR